MRRSVTPRNRNENVTKLAAHKRPGRRQFVEELFAQHAPGLRRFLRARSVRPEETEDVVQELFTRLMDVTRLEDRMTDSAGSVRSFLLTMANNLLVDRQRRRLVRAAYAAAQRENEAAQKDERTPERIVAAQLELEAIRAVILGMPLHWQVALALHRFRNMSYEDIALHMGATAKQIERYLYRAARRLRKARKKIEGAGERPC